MLRLSGYGAIDIEASGGPPDRLPENFSLTVSVKGDRGSAFDTLWSYYNLSGNDWYVQALLGSTNYFHGQGKIEIISVI